MIAQLVKNLPEYRRPWFNFWVRKIHWRRDMLPTAVFLGFPCGSTGKESSCNGGDLGSTPELGRSPGEGKGYPLQYSGLENSMDCIVHRVTKSWTWLSNFHFHLHTPPEPVGIGIIIVENNLAPHLESHQSAHTCWLMLTSGSLFQDNNQKEGKFIHVGVMRVLFSNSEKLELYSTEVGDLSL